MEPQNVHSEASKARGTGPAIRTLSRVVLWVAIGIVLAGLDHLIPRPMPWMKLGLANGAAILALYTLGFRAALAVNLLRVAGVALLLGSWTNPSILLSFGGAVMAVLVMGAAKQMAGKRIGPVGISALGAWVHMATQFVLAAALLAHHGGILVLAGPSLFAAIASGLVIGILAGHLLDRLPKRLVLIAEGK